MITVSTTATDVLTRSYRTHLRVESWRGGVLLAEDVPVDSASEECDRSLRIPERVTFTVPRRDRSVSWAPDGDDHPLAAKGQRLHVKLGVSTVGSQVEWFQRGVFLIAESTADGDVVNVSAVGMLTLIDEAKLVSPFQPSGTLASTLRGLVEPALTVLIDAALVDRAVPAGINFDEDRLGAVLELLDAWPADAYVDPAGYLRVQPTTQSTTPLFTLTDDTGGTVVTVAGTSTREGAYTAVVARGTASDGGQVQGTAFDLDAVFNPLPVPYFFSSPLLTTVGEASVTAATVLARKQREAARDLEVTMVPNPTLQAGDVGTVNGSLCSIEALTLPYVAGGGAQQLSVRLLT
jgi:hypothetical protein